MFEQMSFDELNESIIEGIDDARLAVIRLRESVDDKTLVDNITQCLENIANAAEQQTDAVKELNFN